MFKVTIASIDNPETLLYDESFPTETEARSFLQFNCPSLDVAKLKLGTQKRHNNQYVVEISDENIRDE